MGNATDELVEEFEVAETVLGDHVVEAFLKNERYMFAD